MRFALTAFGILAILLIGAWLALTALATRDVGARLERLDAAHQFAETRHGPIEYVAWGEGPAVLVVHGAGGGFDQGRQFAKEFGGDGYYWIAPSRFGYLASPMPRDASTAAQADAFADLLDHLGVERGVVLAVSGGVPPALQFAERHPDRTTGLVLLSSAPFTPYAPDAGARPIPDWLYQALFGSDTVYWTLSKLMPARLAQAFDARPQLVENLPDDERRFVDQLVDAFLPASRRIDGVFNEGAAIDPGAVYALDQITAPALVVHMRDDQINPFAVGVALSDGLTNATFVPFDTGGHLMLGHHAEVRALVSAFLEGLPEEEG